MSTEPKKVSIREDYRVYNQGGMWGQNITVHMYANDDISHTGCWTPKPRVGDVLVVRMNSGKVGVFIFTEVEPWHDPVDGLSAKSGFVGYVGEQLKHSLKGVTAI